MDDDTNTKGTDLERLDSLVEKSKRTLFIISSVFPFDLFPDTIRIDENKVDIITRHFFFIKQMFPILLKNINGVQVSTGLLFASIQIEVTGYEVNPNPVRFLSKSDAIKAKRIIMGLIAAYKEKIDMSQIPTSELIAKIEQIGKAQEHPNV